MLHKAHTAVSDLFQNLTHHKPHHTTTPTLTPKHTNSSNSASNTTHTTASDNQRECPASMSTPTSPVGSPKARRVSAEFHVSPMLSPKSTRIAQLEAQLAHTQAELAQNRCAPQLDTLGEALSSALTPTTIAAKVNNELLCIQRAMEMNSDAKFELVDVHSELGMSIYCASLRFILGMAARDVAPSKALRVEHSFGVESSALLSAHYCELVSLDDEGETVAEITDDELQGIVTRMNEIVAADLSIDVTTVNPKNALAMFQASNMFYSERLLLSKNVAFVSVNRCLDFASLHHRPLAPRTGMLKVFGIEKYQTGLLLRFPSPEDLSVCKPFTPSEEIHQRWSIDNELWNKLEVGCVGQLNELIMNGESERLCRLCEASHDLKIVEVAKMIAARANDLKMVLIAGPSSSGKTTFATKLSTHLEILGLRPLAISVDDYYRNNTEPDYPRDSHGHLDFENIAALRTDLFNDHLLKLFSGETVEVPRFDFKTGSPKDNGVCKRLGTGGVIIAEGIFCLNNRLTERIPSHQKFQIYISPMSQLNLDEHTAFSNQMIRMIRRVSRDFINRGRNAEQTIRKWQSVRAGEERNLFPFMGNADVVFNSSLEYELPVLSVFVSPLLRTVKPDSSSYLMSRQLLDFLDHFQPIPAQHVPSTSLLMEFIGPE